MSSSRSTKHSTSGFETNLFYASERSDERVEPGEFPFRRGYSKRGYRDGYWGWEMYAGFGSAEDANSRYRFLLENGATGGVSIALDLPTQLGYDSDHSLAQGEVGRIGVALDTYADLEDLFAGIDLGEAGHVFSTANCIGPIFYAWVLEYCERHRIDTGSFRLQIQNDPIKEYYARGTHFLPIEAAVRLATDVVSYSRDVTPNWLPISVSGSHMKQAGASPVQEAAFTIANAVAYMEELVRRGADLADINPVLELHFCTDMDFFEEVAKYRAVREAWSTIANSRFGVDSNRVPVRLHAATSGLPLTAQQPLNNIARITMQVLAQVLGGVEATRTASWDEALAIPTEDAAVVSLRINQIIAHESGVADTADPLGGSWYVESLTDRMVGVINDEVAAIDELGGALTAATNGYYAERLAEGAYSQQVALERGDRVVVGVNKYRDESNVSYQRFTIDEESEARQRSRLEAFRAERSEKALEHALANLHAACLSDENIMPSVRRAVKANATLGEISNVWRSAFGRHKEQLAYL